MNKRKIYQLIGIIILALVLIIGAVLLFLQKDPQDKTQNTTESQTQEGQNNTETGEVDYVSFPYKIPGTTLVIDQVNSYDGIFFEDGSDKEIEDVTAIVLSNTGDECIDYMDITIERDGTQLQFTGSALEPDGTMVVLEANAKKFSKGKYSNCKAEIATSKEMEMSQKQVRVEETAENDLLVKNISGENIPCVRVFYKFYMYDSDVYVAGITYTAKIVDLKAGESRVIRPSHYIKGYSKIVMVKTYDTDD